MKKKTIIQGHVESLAFGGDGIIKPDSQVIFVPFVAPDEEITAEITVHKKSFARAKLIEILQSSPHRIKPECKYFGICGGCQLQHIDYNEQAAIKTLFVRDALQRIGKLPTDLLRPIIKANSNVQWFYRRHIKLHLVNGELGYVRHDLAGSIEIDSCLIFENLQNPIFKDLKPFLPKLLDKIEVAIYKDNNNKYVMLFNLVKNINKNIFKNILANISYIKGIMWKVDNSYYEIGDCNLNFSIENLAITYNPKVFIQAHPEQSKNIYLELINLIKNTDSSKVLDLYCGIGITSLLLAKNNYEVLGIESNNEAILLAQKNASHNSINNINFQTLDADNLSLKYIKEFNPECIIINPPRIGLSNKIIETLLAYNAKNIFYISCMPSTLARDLKLLSTNYTINYIQTYDMFPQTTHVETLVHLVRVLNR